MKIGILNAINPHESRVKWPGPPQETYIRFLQSGDGVFDAATYQVAQDDFPPRPDACDAYVITGSPRGAYDADPWIGELATFIRSGAEQGRKFVGICFGHQILAHALGGEVRKSKKGWGLGLQTYHIEAHKPWMNSEAGELSLYFAHQDQVESLPPSAERLGGNEFCNNGMFCIGDQILGIQGHPEFSRSIMESIIDNRSAPEDRSLVEQARRSLEQGAPDNVLVARWMVNFLGL